MFVDVTHLESGWPEARELIKKNLPSSFEHLAELINADISHQTVDHPLSYFIAVASRIAVKKSIALSAYAYMRRKSLTKGELSHYQYSIDKLSRIDRLRALLLRADHQKSKLMRQLFLESVGNLEHILSFYFVRLYHWEMMGETFLEFYKIDKAILQFITQTQIYSYYQDMYLHLTVPHVYDMIDEYLGMSVPLRRKALKDIMVSIKIRAKHICSHLHIKVRLKQIHSILAKMKRKNIPLEEVEDIHAIRIIVDTQQQCYEMEDLLNRIYFPVPAHRDDYIQRPKQNGYQSIHTVLQHPLLGMVECQIRTRSMHDHCTIGDASHLVYKTAEKGFDEKSRRLLFNKFIAESKTTHADESRYVYVLTPKSEVFELDQGSTPIDFAYKVHTDIGHHCSGARVNGAMVPLTYKLHSGDVVGIIYDKKHEPPREWLDKDKHYVVSKSAIKKIEQFHDIHHSKKQDLHKTLLRLKKVCMQLGIDTASVDQLARHYRFANGNDFLHFMAKKDTDGMAKYLSNKTEKQRKVKRTQAEKISAQVAQCCYPVCGDEIVGYVAVGGCALHRIDCRNIINQSASKKIWIDWDEVNAQGEQCRFIAVLQKAPTSQDIHFLDKASVKIVQKKLHTNQVYVVMSAYGAQCLATYETVKQYLLAQHPGCEVYRWGMRSRKSKL